MKCEDVGIMIVDYLDGKITGKEKEEFEKHIETCESCLDELMHSQKILLLAGEARMEEPDESMRINFYHMLHNETARAGENSIKLKEIKISSWYTRNIFRYAAGIALLVCGSFIGMLISSKSSSKDQATELRQLQSEVALLKRTAMFTMLKDESSSYRIQAVNYADDLEAADDNVIEVLINTLNNDKNVNVRMAAAWALEKFAAQPSVCDSLVKSLSLQTDPILQVTLINILVGQKEKSALRAIQKIISDEKTLEEVKSVAESGARMLQL